LAWETAALRWLTESVLVRSIELIWEGVALLWATESDRVSSMELGRKDETRGVGVGVGEFEDFGVGELGPSF
jgi:hypothetical protein